MTTQLPALQNWPTNAIHEWEGNARRGDVDIIKESMRTNGVFQPIIVQESTGRIIAGNHRFRALKELRKEAPDAWPDQVSVIPLDVSDEEALRIHLADNKTSDKAEWANPELLEQLEALAATDQRLEGTGFDDDELDELRAELAALDEPYAGASDPDDVPDVDETNPPVTAEGDVWLLGDHKLLVGSATDTDAVSAMVGDALPDCVWTDPPYGVEYVGKTKDALTIQNDGSEGLGELLAGAYATIIAVCRPGAPTYIAHADTERITFETTAREAGLVVRQNLVWVKPSLVMGRSDYHYRHEPILYGFTPGGEGRLGRGGDRWYGNDAQTTVLEFDRPSRSEDHPTMKPVDLIQHMLENSCRPGGIVFDPFAGSGSTLVAAHGLGMRSRVVELDPKYADVICRRFEELTGITPIREADKEAVSFTDRSE